MHKHLQKWSEVQYPLNMHCLITFISQLRIFPFSWLILLQIKRKYRRLKGIERNTIIRLHHMKQNTIFHTIIPKMVSMSFCSFIWQSWITYSSWNCIASSIVAHSLPTHTKLNNSLWIAIIIACVKEMYFNLIVKLAVELLLNSYLNVCIFIILFK